MLYNNNKIKHTYNRTTLLSVHGTAHMHVHRTVAGDIFRFISEWLFLSRALSPSLFLSRFLVHGTPIKRQQIQLNSNRFFFRGRRTLFFEYILRIVSHWSLWTFRNQTDGIRNAPVSTSTRRKRTIHNVYRFPSNPLPCKWQIQA